MHQTQSIANYSIPPERSYCSISTKGVSRKSPRVFIVGYILWSTYPGNKPGCFGHTRVFTRVYLPGYPHSKYPGTLTVYTLVPPQYILGDPHSIYSGTPRVHTRVPRRVYTLLAVLNTPLRTSYLRKRGNSKVARALLVTGLASCRPSWVIKMRSLPRNKR